ncbi:hypothetical protein FACS1894179_05820 [Bacteroidia bacterium]|nr:hypothetical protein FACS1894179_05820 [Bacteroidia bacterium]
MSIENYLFSEFRKIYLLNNHNHAETFLFSRFHYSTFVHADKPGYKRASYNRYEMRKPDKAERDRQYCSPLQLENRV